MRLEEGSGKVLSGGSAEFVGHISENALGACLWRYNGEEEQRT